MHLEVFAQGNSILHKLDPRVKIVSFSIYAITVAVLQKTELLAMTLLFSVTLICLARLNFKLLLDRLMAVNVPILLLWIFLPFGFKDDEFFSLWGFGLSTRGLQKALDITLKANSIVIASIAMLTTSRFFMLTQALTTLKVPTKLINLFYLFYRYLSVIHEDYSKLLRTLKVRGFNASTNMRSYRTLANVAGHLVVNSIDRSQRIYKAMLCRGFKDRFPLINEFTINTIDLVFLLTIVICCGVIVLLQGYCYGSAN